MIKFTHRFIGLLLLASVACQSNLAPTPAPTPPPIVMPASTLPPSMKGWELYSWQKDNQWRFVLFVGTNRLKTASEILSSEGAVIGVDGIQTELARLPKGEQVFWGSRGMPEFSFPSAEIQKTLQDFSAQHGITLTIIPQR